jgi:uncharacterized protein YbcV (DUF1398 family)
LEGLSFHFADKGIVRGQGWGRHYLAASWRAGVIRYDVDFAERKVAYYGCNGEEYVEEYPGVEV